MRYPVGQEPDPLYPHGETMHHMLTFSVMLAFIIGIALFFLGRHGKIMWLRTWSIALVGCSVLYLVADAANLF